MTRTSFETINAFRETVPVNVEGLALALGIEVRYAYLDDSISGMVERESPGRFVITINAEDTPTRQRFTLAHEIGHVMLHRSKIGDGLDDDQRYRSMPGGKYHNTAVGPREETQANRFAANVLMPWHLVHDRADRLVQETRANRCDHRIARALAQEFGVSQEAMCIRLGVPDR